MATVAGRFVEGDRAPDVLSGTPRAHAIDRWIYVFMAAWFIVIVLVGFIPDAMMKVAMVKAGARPPFPMILHVHAVLMGSFLLLLLAQTWLIARRRDAGLHKRMVILAIAVPLGAAIDRMTWLPTTMPASPVANYLYVLLAVAPMFVWDVIRNRRVHEAYRIWFPIFVVVVTAISLLWDKPYWHATAKAIMRV